MAKKNPFIVAWVPSGLKLSDGSTQKEFQNHDEAIDFLEAEMKKVAYPIASRENMWMYRKQTGKDPSQGQIECTRLQRGVVMLYGVSERYIVPFAEQALYTT